MASPSWASPLAGNPVPGGRRLPAGSAAFLATFPVKNDYCLMREELGKVDNLFDKRGRAALRR